MIGFDAFFWYAGILADRAFIHLKKYMYKKANANVSISMNYGFPFKVGG